MPGKNKKTVKIQVFFFPLLKNLSKIFFFITQLKNQQILSL